MDNINLTKHISGQFNADLEDVRNRMMTMGGLVEQQLEYSLNALVNNDPELAEKVIDNERVVNGMEVTIDEDCSRIIAKRQPAASDLRLILSIMKSVTELERIADSAERIAKTALNKDARAQRGMIVSLDNMGRQSLKMLNQTLDALARMDAEAALAIHKQDNAIDLEYEAMVRQLMTFMMEDPRSIPNVLEVLWAARALERVGDRCQNITENIIYFVKGKDVRHASYEDIERHVDL
ncbi:phosphate signaling complex protein PhoU [Paraferrimonas sp. SM1919]|uniref:phosphate signaling complex protein PhoU n=1 Tax=Paraferrimonas sp. SM1919 TaxID=2662263 RepID=UPI0013D751FC|nr:phosphate signaling complex protein PhoU [Paraferrimonas sp. SM1919]